MACQSTGKIIAGGGHLKQLVRYNTDGSVDSSFGVNGVAFQTGSTFDAMVIQKDDKIIYSTLNDSGLCTIKRILANGKSLDNSFGIGGRVTIRQKYYPYGGGIINSIVLQENGEIVACGILGDQNGLARGVSFFGRFKTNGTRDTAFGTYGQEDSLTNYNDTSLLNALAIQPDEKILLTGNSSSLFIKRYLSDGRSLDPDFYNGLTKVNLGFYSNPGELFLCGNKIFVGGSYEYEYGNNGYFKYVFAVLGFNDSAAFAYPVTWLSFIANKKDDGVLLDWETAGEETNNNYFSVERSRDGQDFYDIGSVKSKGILSQTAEYDFTDVEPLNGENYYRIKQVDLNGNYTYTDVKNINFENASAITIYPNPSSSHINVDGLDLASNPKIFHLRPFRKTDQTIHSFHHTFQYQH